MHALSPVAYCSKVHDTENTTKKQAALRNPCNQHQRFTMPRNCIVLENGVADTTPTPVTSSIFNIPSWLHAPVPHHSGNIGFQNLSDLGNALRTVRSTNRNAKNRQFTSSKKRKAGKHEGQFKEKTPRRIGKMVTADFHVGVSSLPQKRVSRQQARDSRRAGTRVRAKGE